MTSTVYLLCGLPGAGKTTRAKELEADGKGVLLNADSWVCHLYPDDAEAAARDERKGLVEQVQWELVERLVGDGISVILDWGVWTRAERDRYRKRARDLGAEVRTVFVDAPIETLHERVADKNRETIEEMGVAEAEAILAEIQADRDASYRRLAAGTES